MVLGLCRLLHAVALIVSLLLFSLPSVQSVNLSPLKHIYESGSELAALYARAQEEFNAGRYAESLALFNELLDVRSASCASAKSDLPHAVGLSDLS